jgi:hypothetical protein
MRRCPTRARALRSELGELSRVNARRERARLLFPGEGRGPGQREPLLDAAAWTPAYAGER